MPITTNVGGVLYQLTGVYGTDGGVIKPMGGVIRDNLPHTWGGFTGSSKLEYYNVIYMGELTIKGGAYITLSLQNTDDLSNHYNDNNCFDVVNTIAVKSEKSFSFSSGTWTRYRQRWTNSLLNTTSNHESEKSLSNYNNVITCKPFSLDEGTYYIYAGKYALSSSSRSNFTSVTDTDGVKYVNPSFIDMSELSFKFNIKVETSQS